MKKQLIQALQQLKEQIDHNQKKIAQQVQNINSILKQMEWDEEINPKIQGLDNEQLQQEAQYKTSSLEPQQVDKDEFHTPSEPQDHYEADGDWLEYYEQRGQW